MKKYMFEAVQKDGTKISITVESANSIQGISKALIKLKNEYPGAKLGDLISIK